MNQVHYETPVAVSEWGRKRVLLAVAVGVVVASGVALLAGFSVASSFLALAAGGLLFGVNTVTYTTPVAGVTAPTASQSRSHQEVTATITGDGAATDFTVTHNWALTAAELAAGWPRVSYEYLLASGYTAAALVTSKTANAVVFGNTAFAGAGLRVRLERPHTINR